MNLLNQVRAKLISAFLLVAILIAVVGTIGGIEVKRVNKNAETMYSVNLQSVNEILSIKSNMSQIKSEVSVIMYDQNKKETDKAKKNITDMVTEDNEYIAKYEKLITTAEEKENWTNFTDNVTKYRDARNRIIDAADLNDSNEVTKQYMIFLPIEDEMLASLDKVIEINLTAAKVASDNINLSSARTNIIMILMSIVGFIIAVLLGIFMSSHINKPLRKIRDYAERLAMYDFSTPIAITRKDEFGQTGIALNKAQKNVNILVKEIMENSQDISASSEELSATAEELSLRARSIDDAIANISDGMQESSAAAEEISASVEEVDSSVNELSGKAMEGSSSSSKSKEKATEVKNSGKKAIEETRNLYAEKENKMLEVIEDGKVVDNIKVMADTIGSIAEQTNLLALNAAIEAARAGEQGKGFAVVAEEVRTLAEQSSQAVTSIQETINRVRDAFKNSIDTGNDILSFINTEVHRQFNAYMETGDQYYNDSNFVSMMSEEIAAMSEEITATVGQVSEVVQDMAQTTQKSSEEVTTIKESMDEATKAIEQVALTAHSQAELAQRLNEMVQKFKI
ncbi:methyl-accepting chemotaxis protein [Clostridium beijerinckii]|jgi:Methyl-accepting chemotaxis protein|uniref:Methyl-accepting chemotaxis protein n=2 Tax=Clostridium beijerinckii TaxID=1520 RepID=A0AAE2V0J5_CLOBE|nr:methyl-accepting chemotaxis protein [Clostridium beijerinckii]ABR36544.1 methyl-accepting chemotaxis sensory transducer [Clostridium beijerinckii NCIMB 8052]AIU02611.1 methyl-accepting chemotaxis sensory transducer [Clostridium beijerinckii ATCC 35702]MBF7808808.1 methyl-accepting chemotaxis protein [Clostridium beijerinckii]NRT22387.1 methyl-accepting chemotaxis protein [Clostridium beijerinckii]NRT65100.1 methyl-accepting chemotaxis protein [Clostridium beijerinckii]